ncbi:deoxycytidylate deaminase isoform X2 [Aethina tumida]|uniref:deoxycytidylate deaminase isoform X2 n=1 Tax=Aethina tumida TaxID=116153 RepID=UPI002147DE03|nr:deoxycytidylate deaminase isoform X2 [Aethina tumida]
MITTWALRCWPHREAEIQLVNDDEFPWGKTSINPLETKFFYVCHAEMNAIMGRTCRDLKGCTIYVTRFPCNECAKLIIQSEIGKVWYLTEYDDDETTAAKRMFDAANVSYKQYTSNQSKIEIHLSNGIN